MKKLDLSYLAYLDKNSSYRWTMSQNLFVDGFE